MPQFLNSLFQIIKLESSAFALYFNPSKAWNFNPSENNNKQLISSFRRVEISNFRRVEISKQTNAKADDSNFIHKKSNQNSSKVTTVLVRFFMNKSLICGLFETYELKTKCTLSNNERKNFHGSVQSIIYMGTNSLWYKDFSTSLTPCWSPLVFWNIHFGIHLKLG